VICRRIEKHVVHKKDKDGNSLIDDDGNVVIEKPAEFSYRVEGILNGAGEPLSPWIAEPAAQRLLSIILEYAEASDGLIYTDLHLKEK